MPLLHEIAFAAEESVRRTRLTCHPRSIMRLCMPMRSAAPFTTAYSSDSPLLNATVPCVELHVFRHVLANVTMPPLVDFLVFLHPAQSASTYTTMRSYRPYPSKTSSISGCLTRYLANFFSLTQSLC